METNQKYPLPKYKIHPAIGIARVGNSPDFYLAPETVGGLPIACDSSGATTKDDKGNEKTTTEFKDGSNRVLKQAARFQIWVYDDKHPEGRELKIGDTINWGGTSGKLLDIEWTVWVANKKSVWYEFKQLEGEHGYAPDHPLRNADITGDARQYLITDPGSQTVFGKKKHGQVAAEFAEGQNSRQAQIFPPELQPRSVKTLGSVKTLVTEDQNIRLIFLGGEGNSGSSRTGFADPRIQTYANNDGWYDDISDGPVTARLLFEDASIGQVRYADVGDPAWVIVGYPSFAPQIVDMITMDETIYDMSVREFAYRTDQYGRGNFDNPEKVDIGDPAALQLWRDAPKTWNRNYYPLFWKEIFPILARPYYMQFTTSFLATSNDAHEIGPGGDFEKSKISIPPRKGQGDPFKFMRQFIYEMLRRPGEENRLINSRDEWNITGNDTPNTIWFAKELMPLLNGDNPLSNTNPSKFLRLTDHMLFLLRQWAEGKFINEKLEDFGTEGCKKESKGELLDRGVLSNALGGAFCPGAETGWIIRNPKIFRKPYRINLDHNYVPGMNSRTVKTTLGVNAAFTPPLLSPTGNLCTGMQPGDITKYSAIPWQSDFNECTTQPVAMTYEDWVVQYSQCDCPDKAPEDMMTKDVLWWPSHRPLQVYQRSEAPPKKVDEAPQFSYQQVEWARGIPENSLGDFKMVTEWTKLGFILYNYEDPNLGNPRYVEVDSQL